jgi:hypothetical protein
MRILIRPGCHSLRNKLRSKSSTIAPQIPDLSPPTTAFASKPAMAPITSQMMNCSNDMRCSTSIPLKCVEFIRANICQAGTPRRQPKGLSAQGVEVALSVPIWIFTVSVSPKNQPR